MRAKIGYASYKSAAAPALWGADIGEVITAAAAFATAARSSTR
jgi:hypothetical protein